MKNAVLDAISKKLNRGLPYVIDELREQSNFRQL
jgi:hypothetical protein